MKLVRYEYPTLNTARDFGNLLGDFRGFFPRLEDFWQEPAFAEVPADLYEDDADVYARFELPGFKKDEIKLELENSVLTVNVERKAKKDEDEEVSLSRSISLPDNVETDKVAAKYEDGILTVTVPKAPEKKAKLIAIE
jgi:HSP20 family protein